MLVGTIFSACVRPLVAFSQCGIAYCNVLVLKNIEKKIMNYELWIIIESKSNCINYQFNICSSPNCEVAYIILKLILLNYQFNNQWLFNNKFLLLIFKIKKNRNVLQLKINNFSPCHRYPHLDYCRRHYHYYYESILCFYNIL